MPLRYSFVLLLVLALAAPAVAGVPSPSNSTVPSCFVACPLGDVEYRVVVRDIGNFPIVNCLVEIDLSGCPGLSFCPVQPTDITWNPATRRASRTSDATGTAVFHLKMGGTCPTVTVPAIACGVVLGSASVASPDQDADLFVGASDVLIVNGLIGTTNRGADFDCDGLVTTADLAFLTDLHGGHSCDPAVPARHRSWGGNGSKVRDC